jgi:3-methyladenine DNA glycosylase/8-oxoguanine DNA glycosylase
MERLTVAVTPLSPFELPRMAGGDRAVQMNDGAMERLLIVSDAAAVVRVRQVSRDQVIFDAEPLDPGEVSGKGAETLGEAGEEHLEEAIVRMRFATGVDDDLKEMAERFRDDELIGRAVRSRLHRRLNRRPFPWEAFAWGVTEQLIEYKRAASIQRRMIHRWGMEARGLRTVPDAGVVAKLAPAELESAGLSPKRSIAMIRAAREVDRGHCNLEKPADDKRLLAIPEIGPWTIACLGLHGRGDADALLAGDLSQVKLVGYMTGLGRIATVEEVEEFYVPYSPWRGWAASFMVSLHGKPVHGAGSYHRLRANLRRPEAA